MEQVVVNSSASQEQEEPLNIPPLKVTQIVLVDDNSNQLQERSTEAPTDNNTGLPPNTEQDAIVDGNTAQKQECNVNQDNIIDGIVTQKKEVSTGTPIDTNPSTPPKIEQDILADSSNSQKQEFRMEQIGLVDGSFIQEQEEPHFIPPPNMITIIVGPEDDQKHFCAHKELICYHSPWFFKAVHGLSAEGNRKIMIEHKTLMLDNVDPKVFICLFQWLYTKEVTVAEESNSESIRLDTLKTLAQLWLLGQTLKMPRFQDDVLELLELKIKVEVNVACQFWAWLYDLEETKGSLMIRILVTFRLFLCWPAVDPEMKEILPEGYPLHFEEMAQAFSAFERNDEFDEYMRSFCFQVVRRECGNILSLM